MQYLNHLNHLRHPIKYQVKTIGHHQTTSAWHQLIWRSRLWELSQTKNRHLDSPNHTPRQILINNASVMLVNLLQVSSG
jgi:hypothetical protein